MPPSQDLDTALPRPPWGDVFISWLGAFLGILAISGVNQAMLPELHASLLVASFGVHPLRGRSCNLATSQYLPTPAKSVRGLEA